MNEKLCQCGFVLIVGRSNVGKSTLFNRLIGKKISITSHKIHTTQKPVIGIYNKNVYQSIYIDTPGFFNKKYMDTNFLLKKKTDTSFNEVNLILFIIEKTIWTEEDENMFDTLNHTDIPTILVINKIDKIHDKTKLLPFIKYLSKKSKNDIIPVSAKKNDNISLLFNRICKYLSIKKRLFSGNNVIHQTKKHFISEIIREKIMRFLNKELPYLVNIKINSFLFKNKQDIFYINSTIWIKKNRQKKIIIGEHANVIKLISKAARKDIEFFLKKKVYLDLWVQSKEFKKT
ncbi:GTPase Era [Candidatus Tachikawaea gelatinosa]|uniref:GTPase Era n=1 Tax=Candidatus Tachikawaea gelatinosa TaxID=1410383 RepID=A0A090AJL1_9ENTR|nr:GTPase Era [Candidatus Tachikawaea gelatinosa]BAP58633.1 GTPase Era [Candidatus Tachikawaea gelatinosa]